jgi:hypothetical protein
MLGVAAPLVDCCLFAGVNYPSKTGKLKLAITSVMANFFICLCLVLWMNKAGS